MKFAIRVFLISFFISLPVWYGINLFQENLEKFFYAQISQPLREMNFVKIPEKPQKPNLDLQTRTAISVKINKFGGERILFRKKISQPFPIASLTKLTTALIVLEDKNYDLENGEIAISQTAANQENVPTNYGNLDLEMGKKFKVKDLLDLMLVYSSNDVAYALSEVIKVDQFVLKMNQKAKELGLENTHFINPTGLDPDGLHYDPVNLPYFNYSSAEDLVKISQYILKEHPLIFEISLQKPISLVKDGIFDLFLTQEVIGGKTGYTDEAGGCILFIFKNENGSIFINVILGAPSSAARIEEMQKLINWIEK